MKLEEARQLANELLPILAPFCSRIEVAGGIRRGKEEPHDIELVAKPFFKDLTGDLVVDTLDGVVGLPVRVNDLDVAMHRLMRERTIQPGIVRENHRDGKAISMRAPFSEKYYNFQFQEQSVDLFVVTPPAEWGPVFTIRTGDASFTHWMVSYGWPKGIYFRHGYIVQHVDAKGRYIAEQEWKRQKYPQCDLKTCGFVTLHAPEEEDVFRILGLPQYTPEQRSDPHIYTGMLMSV